VKGTPDMHLTFEGNMGTPVQKIWDAFSAEKRRLDVPAKGQASQLGRKGHFYPRE